MRIKSMAYQHRACLTPHHLCDRYTCLTCLPPLQPCHPATCILRPAITGPTILQALSSCWVLATSILVWYNTLCRHDAVSSTRLESFHAICITSLATLQLSVVLYDHSMGWAFIQDLSTASQRHILAAIDASVSTRYTEQSCCLHG